MDDDGEPVKLAHFEQRLKNEIKLALSDPSVYNSMSEKVAKILRRRKKEKPTIDKDLIKLNVESMGVWN